MNASSLFGFSASLLIGLSLGLIGGGGSILTLPVLVYLLHINPVLSTVYSLFVVGTTALVGSVGYMRSSLVDYRAAAAFAIPSFTTVFLTRRYVIPSIPDPLVALPGMVVTKDAALLVFFALIMLGTSFSMIRDKRPVGHAPGRPGTNYPVVAGEGAAVGVLTGLVGAGGGFLIVPALVLFARLPMKTAVGTSLLIIAANSLIGFLSDLAHTSIDWPFLAAFTALSVAGILAGSYLSRFIAGEKLKRAFGWFVLVMAVSILVKEMTRPQAATAPTHTQGPVSDCWPALATDQCKDRFQIWRGSSWVSGTVLSANRPASLAVFNTIQCCPLSCSHGSPAFSLGSATGGFVFPPNQYRPNQFATP